VSSDRWSNKLKEIAGPFYAAVHDLPDQNDVNLGSNLRCCAESASSKASRVILTARGAALDHGAAIPNLPSVWSSACWHQPRSGLASAQGFAAHQTSAMAPRRTVFSKQMPQQLLSRKRPVSGGWRMSNGLALDQDSIRTNRTKRYASSKAPSSHNRRLHRGYQNK